MSSRSMPGLNLKGGNVFQDNKEDNQDLPIIDIPAPMQIVR